MSSIPRITSGFNGALRVARPLIDRIGLPAGQAAEGPRHRVRNRHHRRSSWPAIRGGRSMAPTSTSRRSRTAASARGESSITTSWRDAAISPAPTTSRVLFDTLEHIEHTEALPRRGVLPFEAGRRAADQRAGVDEPVRAVSTSWAGHFRRYTRRNAGARVRAVRRDDSRPGVLGIHHGAAALAAKTGAAAARRRTTRSFTLALSLHHPWIHALLKGVMAVETALVKRPPLGSSVMSAVRKNATEAVTMRRGLLIALAVVIVGTTYTAGCTLGMVNRISTRHSYLLDPVCDLETALRDPGVRHSRRRR